MLGLGNSFISVLLSLPSLGECLKIDGAFLPSLILFKITWKVPTDVKTRVLRGVAFVDVGVITVNYFVFELLLSSSALWMRRFANLY